MKLDARLYQSYLLRMWRDDTDGEWRASLQNTKSCQMVYFSDLKSLFDFLCVKTDTGSLIDPEQRDRMKKV